MGGDPNTGSFCESANVFASIDDMDAKNLTIHHVDSKRTKSIGEFIQFYIGKHDNND